MNKDENENETIQRVVIPELDKILGVQFKVLDDGFIRVVDYMGGDASVVQAARVSYGAGTKKLSEDEGLIRFLLRHSHTTPFEMCDLKLHVRVPMDCWRQWIRHRTASVNEYSTRYSVAIDACQKTESEEWRSQSKKNKQGSAEPVTEFPEGWSHPEYLADEMKLSDPGEYLSLREQTVQKFTREVYEERLSFDVAREQSRKDLPLSNYTEAYWKVNLHNLLHFLGLRMDSHAQFEIREYANIIGEKIVRPWVPLTWAAFNDYNFRREAVLLTARDKQLLKCLCDGNQEELLKYAEGYGWTERKKDNSLKINRERNEFEGKVKEFGFTEFPWNL